MTALFFTCNFQISGTVFQLRIQIILFRLRRIKIFLAVVFKWLFARFCERSKVHLTQTKKKGLPHFRVFIYLYMVLMNLTNIKMGNGFAVLDHTCGCGTARRGPTAGYLLLWICTPLFPYLTRVLPCFSFSYLSHSISVTTTLLIDWYAKECHFRFSVTQAVLSLTNLYKKLSRSFILLRAILAWLIRDDGHEATREWHPSIHESMNPTNSTRCAPNLLRQVSPKRIP